MTLDAGISPYRQHLHGFVAALALLAGSALAAPASTPDPVEGKWWGEVVTPQERTAIGFEFFRDASGALRARFTQPVATYYGLDAPGIVQRDGDQVSLPEMKLAFTLAGDRLSGTFGRGGYAVDLRRSDSLPGPPAPPDVPTGAGPRWQTRLNGQVFASPVVADGIAFVGSTGGVFNAVRTTDGSFAWTFSAGRPIFGAALVAGDAVYFTCDNGYLFKLERATGKEVWRYDLGDERVPRIIGHPVVYDWDWQGVRPVLADGVLFAGSGDGSLHAVDAATGARRWRATTGGKLRNGAAIDGDRVIVGSADHFVYAFDRASGSELWKHDTGFEVDGEPVVDGGRILVGNRGGGLYALAAATGEQLWRTSFWGSWIESTPIVVDGVIYVGASDLAHLSAIDPADGRVLWRSDVYGWSFGTPLVTADRIYAGAAGGTPYFVRHVASFSVLDRRTGRLLARWPLPDSPGGHQWGIAGSLALAGDTVVATTIDGSIYGFPLN